MSRKLSEREQAYRALQRRRLKIADECKQLKRDIESYNANNPWGAIVDMPSFDFTEESTKAAERSAKGGG